MKMKKTPPSISQRSIAKASGSQRRTNDVSVIKTPSPRKRRGAETPKSKESSSSLHIQRHRAQRNKSVEKHSDERPEYEVEAVVGKRVNSKKKAEYQVKWKGYKQLSWEPLANLHCADLIQAYEDLIENNVKKSLSPAVKRKSMSRAAKTSPKPLVTKTAAAGSAKKRSPAHTSKTPVTNNRPRRGSSKSQVKVRTQSSARKSPLAKAKKSIQQVSFLDKTAEEIFGALVAKNLASLSADASNAAQVEILEILNQAKDKNRPSFCQDKCYENHIYISTVYIAAISFVTPLLNKFV